MPQTLAGKWRDVSTDLAYLQYRMRLFKLFCAPSIAAQTNTNFTWIVLFGSDASGWLQDEIKSFGQLFIPLYSDKLEHAITAIKELIGVHAKPGDKVFTTRLDNDDALAVGYVQSVQSSIRANVPSMYFDAVHGHQFVLRDKIKEWKFYSLKYSHSPFASMVETFSTVEALKLIYHKPHGSLKAGYVDAPVIMLGASPLWLQVLHGKNIGNRLMSNKIVKADIKAFPWLEQYLEKGLPCDSAL